MLTLNQLKAMPPHTVFATGFLLDTPEGLFMASTERMLRWVAIRGEIHDWAVYCHFAENSIEDVKKVGDKVGLESHIKKCVPCDDEAFEMYRY